MDARPSSRALVLPNTASLVIVLDLMLWLRKAKRLASTLLSSLLLHLAASLRRRVAHARLVFLLKGLPSFQLPHLIVSSSHAHTAFDSPFMVKREAGLMPDSRRKTPPPSIQHAAGSDASSSGVLSTIQVTTSLLFRLVVYVFLRWIPTSLAWPLVPILYGTYTLAWLVQQRRLASTLRSATAIEELGRSLPVTGHKLGVSTGAPLEHEAEKATETNSETKALLPKPATDSPAETATSATQQASLPPAPSSASPSLWAKISPLIFGASSRSAKANVLSFGIHTLLMLFFLDAYSSPYLFPSHEAHNLHFARVGALSPTSATIHVRYPYPLGAPGTERFRPLGALVEDDDGGSTLREGRAITESPTPLCIVYREVTDAYTSPVRDTHGRFRQPSKRWERGPELTLLAANDWTAASTVQDLSPATQYEWRLAFVHNSSFTQHPARPRKFTTWPDATTARAVRPVSVRTRQEEDVTPWDDPNHFTFAASSCVKPDFPWLPTQFWAWSWALRLFDYGTHGGYATRNRIPGFDVLAAKLIDGRERPSIRFFLQLGDVIYADVPRWGGAATEAYRKLYRNLYASESFRRVYERLPIIGIADDHETRNNWSGLELVDKEDEEVPQLVPNKLVPFAMQAWREYIGQANPAPLDAAEMYYTFRYGDSAFFVLDTRGHRVPPQVDEGEKKTMLGHKQKDALLRWLGAVNSTSTFKFIVSSVPMTTLWGGPLDVDGSTDSWNAYRHEREQLLQVMQYVAGGVIVISGDRHEFAAVGMRAEDSPFADAHAVTEISTSPLSMFYLPVKTFAQDHGLGPTGAEKVYHYQPTGNIKWTEFEVDSRNPLQPVVTAILKVDGEESYRLKIYGKPVKSAIAVGDMARSFLELLGIKQRTWF